MEPEGVSPLQINFVIQEELALNDTSLLHGCDTTDRALTCGCVDCTPLCPTVRTFCPVSLTLTLAPLLAPEDAANACQTLARQVPDHPASHPSYVHIFNAKVETFDFVLVCGFTAFVGVLIAVAFAFPGLSCCRDRGAPVDPSFAALRPDPGRERRNFLEQFMYRVGRVSASRPCTVFAVVALVTLLLGLGILTIVVEKVRGLRSGAGVG